MDTVIEVNSLSKFYRLGTIGARTFGEDLMRSWARVRGRPDPLLANTIDQPNVEGAQLWAVRNLTFDVRQGEILGIIGRNGAGKSTLLKILSRITAPTSGEVRVRGRAGSLLEVGTGFHPELTGRENVYLNGTVLGMTRREINRKFDEIVEFSGVAKFIDTPVKRYSSGMHVRLAFAVAAHLEPEILIIDEVLAVGDAEFQRRCLGKMGEVARHGRTILFVSHNMGAISELCTSAMLLQQGQAVASGSVPDVLEHYSRLLSAGAADGGDSERTFPVDPRLACSITSVRVSGVDDRPRRVFDMNEPIRIAFRYRVVAGIHGLQFALTLSRNLVDLVHTFDTDHLDQLPFRAPGIYEATYEIPPLWLKAGAYSVRLNCGQPTELFQDFESIVRFDIDELSMNTISRGFKQQRPGHVVSQGSWQTTVVDVLESTHAAV
jgi:lipopolysaccharide transport system ATP-binding protein